MNDATHLREGVEDKLRWKAEPSGEFSVDSICKWCEYSQRPIMLPPKLLWNNISHPKVQFLSWFAWIGRVKIKVFLQKIGVLNINANTTCGLCNG